MENFLRIYSIILLGYVLISCLWGSINKSEKKDRTSSIFAAIMIAPIFIYIIKF